MEAVAEKVEKTYEKMIEDIKTNAITTIATSIAGKKQKDENGVNIVDENGREVRGNSFAPFLRDQKAENLQRAYNASTGNAFMGINSLLLDIKKAEFGYQTNQWVTLRQARMLGASEADIQKAQEQWQEKSVQTHFVNTKIAVPAYEKDENGNKIPLLDKEGNQRYALDKDGNRKLDENGNSIPLYKFKYEDTNIQLKDKDGKLLFNEDNQPIMKQKQVFEIQNVEPKLDTNRLYNLAEFPSVVKERVKPLNKESEYKHIYRHLHDEKKSKGVILQDLEKISPTTREQIEHYFKAQNFKQDYKVPQALNERQKAQVAEIANKIVEKSANAQKPQEQTQEKAQEKAQENVQENARAHKPAPKKKGGYSH